MADDWTRYINLQNLAEARYHAALVAKSADGAVDWARAEEAYLWIIAPLRERAEAAMKEEEERQSRYREMTKEMRQLAESRRPPLNHSLFARLFNGA